MQQMQAAQPFLRIQRCRTSTSTKRQLQKFYPMPELHAYLFPNCILRIDFCALHIALLYRFFHLFVVTYIQFWLTGHCQLGISSHLATLRLLCGMSGGPFPNPGWIIPYLELLGFLFFLAFNCRAIQLLGGKLEVEDLRGCKES